MAQSRRGFLKRLISVLMLATVWPGHGWARLKIEGEPESETDAFQRVLAEALNGRSWAETGDITIDVPHLAENGAIVPITVESRLPNTGRILIFAEKNPGPLLAQFRFEPGTDGWVSLRLKLNETGPVLAIAESEGKFYGVQKTVKVMVGGCG